MQIEMPKEVNIILNILDYYKYEGYIVGGCVRDSILGRNPNDWDICTNCTPHRVMEIFSRFKVIPTGLKHGTVTVVIDDKHFEITTYRVEKEYIDGRRPKEVKFTSSLKADLKRRDFTINAMAYNLQNGLIDYYGGIRDIADKKIKCVGDPFERFSEDYLRMLRAVRFCAQLDYNLDVQAFKAIKNLSKNIVNISSERVREELNKILLSDNPAKGLELLNETNLLKFIIPELQRCVDFEQKNPYHDKDVFMHTLCVLENTEKDLVLRLAALLHDIGKPQCFSIDKRNIGHFYKHHLKGKDITEDILKKLKYDNKTIESVKILVKEHMSKFNNVTPKGVKRLINRVGAENIDRLFKLQIADILGSKPPHDFSNIQNAKELCEKVLNEKQPMTIKDLDINGYDLIELGIPPGKEIGIILNKLLDIVLDNPILNKKEVLIEKAGKLYKK
jgi:tRNA nucleotidyltransferase (CCA-adding enzyme)